MTISFTIGPGGDGGATSLVASDTVTVADDGFVFEAIGIEDPDLGGDTLVPSVGLTADPGTAVEMINRDPNATGAHLKYIHTWQDAGSSASGNADYHFWAENDSGVELSIAWAVIRVSV